MVSLATTSLPLGVFIVLTKKIVGLILIMEMGCEYSNMPEEKDS
jgi:hypothetical protein